MIDWESENWGGGVTKAANGSWVRDRHTQEPSKKHREAEPDDD